MAETVLQSHHADLISSVAMCIARLAIFAYLPPADFLEPAYRTESVGKYAVTVTNIGTETTKITVAYGHSIPEIEGQEIHAILGASCIVLIIVGSYLFLHTNFKILAKEKK